jgi:hypothetical protein
MKKGEVSIHLSITTLNVNGLNSPIKSYRVAEWIKSEDAVSAVYKKLTSLAKTPTD